MILMHVFFAQKVHIKQQQKVHILHIVIAVILTIRHFTLFDGQMYSSQNTVYPGQGVLDQNLHGGVPTKKDLLPGS